MLLLIIFIILEIILYFICFKILPYVLPFLFMTYFVIPSDRILNVMNWIIFIISTMIVLYVIYIYDNE